VQYVAVHLNYTEKISEFDGWGSEMTPFIAGDHDDGGAEPGEQLF
jgi:hypothetical protein